MVESKKEGVADLTIGLKVSAFVELVKEDVVVVSIPSHDIVAYATAHSSNMRFSSQVDRSLSCLSTMSYFLLLFFKSVFKCGQKVSGTIVAIGKKSEGFNGLPLIVLELASETKKKKKKDKSGSEDFSLWFDESVKSADDITVLTDDAIFLLWVQHFVCGLRWARSSK